MKSVSLSGKPQSVSITRAARSGALKVRGRIAFVIAVAAIIAVNAASVYAQSLY